MLRFFNMVLSSLFFSACASSKIPISRLIVITLSHLVSPKQNLAKTHKILPNRVFCKVQANDLGAAGRPGCLSCLHRTWICMTRGPLSPVGWWELRSGSPAGSRWLPAVWDSQGCPAQCQPRHRCQLNSTICPCPAFHSASLVKTSQDGSPRWLCMTATAEGMLEDAESCCAVVAIIQAGLGWCYTIYPPQHLLSCETAT